MFIARNVEKVRAPAERDVQAIHMALLWSAILFFVLYYKHPAATRPKHRSNPVCANYYWFLRNDPLPDFDGGRYCGVVCHTLPRDQVRPV